MRPELDGDGPSAPRSWPHRHRGLRELLFTSCLSLLCAFVLPDMTVGVEMCAEMWGDHF